MMKGSLFSKMPIKENISYFDLGYIDANQTIQTGTELTISETLRDICIQIDDKIFLCAYIILYFYAFSNIIIPNINLYMIKNNLHKYTKYTKRLMSFLDTGAVMSVLFIIAIGLYQYGFKHIWGGIILIFIMLISRGLIWRK